MPRMLEASRRRLDAAWRDRPLLVVLAVAVLLRLIAAVLSKGFAFHDDHFEVVEVAQGWLDGERAWLGNTDWYRSVFYPGLHWALFGALEALGLRDPQAKMLVVRLVNGAWSLVTVVYGYRIAEALAGRERARVAGLALAAFWLAPFMAVHDLIETACQPPLVVATWLLVRDPEGPGWRDALAAGLWLGLAFALRLQTAVFAVGLGLVLLARRRLGAALLLGAGAALSAAVLQGGSDGIGYGKPFSSVLAYLAYNSNPENVRGFPQGPWYQYLLTLAGVLVPPTSLLLLYGAARGAARRPLLFWPALAFVAFHSAYPGKQERFLLPVLPFVLLAGVLGALELLDESPGWRRRPRLGRAAWGWFWAVNVLLLALYTANYSKRTRVEPLSFLRGRADLRGVVLETSEARPPFVPRFYLGRPVPVVEAPASKPVEAVQAEIAAAGAAPNYLVMTGATALEARLARLRPVCRAPQPVETFRPGLVDWLLHRLNPRHNVNLVARVYRCG
jgi:hypothetical protein